MYLYICRYILCLFVHGMLTSSNQQCCLCLFNSLFNGVLLLFFVAPCVFDCVNLISVKITWTLTSPPPTPSPHTSLHTPFFPFFILYIYVLKLITGTCSRFVFVLIPLFNSLLLSLPLHICCLLFTVGNFPPSPNVETWPLKRHGSLQKG